MAESRKAIYAAIGANLAIAATKFTAAAFTGSSAMISEGIHSLLDTGDGGLLLLGIERSHWPADAVHLEQTVDRLEETIRKRYPDVKHIFIESDSLPSADRQQEASS
jgi:divalent metal cation (Fe/Co/Zn/Cd) transporter